MKQIFNYFKRPVTDLTAGIYLFKWVIRISVYFLPAERTRLATHLPDDSAVVDLHNRITIPSSCINC